MTSANKSVAKAVAAKTARACDSCIRKRARWYCAADDAFLCQSCDSLVHSANPLARRHQRLRLKTSSFKPSENDVVSVSDLTLAPPTWHRGFTKKPRTPRHGKHHHHSRTTTQEPSRNNPFHLVPEFGSDEYSNSHDENEEQLLYRVPIFDAELCTDTPPSSVTESKVSLGNNNNNSVENFPSEMELAEFAADVESLLGRGLENECIGMEDLGLIDNSKLEEEEEEEEYSVVGSHEKVVKVETTDNQMEEIGIMRSEPFELSFDYDESPAATCQEEVVGEEKQLKNDDDDADINNNDRKRKRKILLLQLDYEAVISAWACEKSPWTTGDKPEFDPDDECWPHCMGRCGIEVHQNEGYYYGEMGGYGCNGRAMGDGGREARVTRYREKRRTRLFSKKIRYEVRKLNAEKRPRMKGRFVKRASFAVAPPPAFPLICSANK